jgi:hypothetical protein
VLEAIDNIQILHECKVSRDAHFANRQNRKRAGVNRDIVRKGAANEEAMYADEDEGLVLDHLERIAQARFNHIASTAAHISDSIMAADISGMFSHDPATLDENISNDSTSEGWAGSHTLVEDAHPIPEYDWNKSYQARKEQWKQKVSTPSVLEAPSQPENSAGASSVSDGSAFRTPVNNSKVYQEVLGVHSAVSLTATQNNILLPATVDEVIAEYTLNTEQARDFRIIAEHSLENRESPLRMLLGGPGGTGKSRVINSLTDFFLQEGVKVDVSGWLPTQALGLET